MFGFHFVLYLVKNVNFNYKHFCKKCMCFGQMGNVGGLLHTQAPRQKNL